MFRGDSKHLILNFHTLFGFNLCDFDCHGLYLFFNSLVRFIMKFCKA